jgi:hypothetical protein
MLTTFFKEEERLKALLLWTFDSDDPETKRLSNIVSLYKNAHEHLQDLRDWCIYRQQSGQLASIGLAAAVVALNKGN